MYNYLALELVAFITINHLESDIRKIFAVFAVTTRRMT